VLIRAIPYTFSRNNVAARSYSLTAVATDALGNTSTSAAVNVTSDQGPVVTLTNPAKGAQITSSRGVGLPPSIAQIHLVWRTIFQY
jgi:chitinase